MRFRPQVLSLGYQIQAMHADFPGFRFFRKSGVPTWRGTLQPTEASPVYEIRLVYHFPKVPQVWIVSPKLQANAPHRYGNEALCLYYPQDRSWQPTMKLSVTFVPWTVLWLAFYEIWLVTGQWFGEEASHQESEKPGDS